MNSTESTVETHGNNYLISIPLAPSLQTILSNQNDEKYSWLFSLTSKSLPISTISIKLKLKLNKQISSNTKRNILFDVFESLSSPIEKYNFIGLILPTKVRWYLLSKHQIIKHLRKYTHTESTKSGNIRNLIDDIKTGKVTESVRDEFIYSIINVLINFWDESKLLKNSDFRRFKNIGFINNNQITLESISVALDNLKSQNLESSSIENNFSYVEIIFDMLFNIYNSQNTDLEINKFSIYLVLSCILNKCQYSEDIVFNSLCLNPRRLAAAIYKSRSSIWDVIYNIEYLKIKDSNTWNIILNATKNEQNGRLRTRTKYQSFNQLIFKIIPGVPCAVTRCSKIVDDYDVIVDRICDVQDATSESRGFCIEEKLDGERSVLHIWRDPNNTEKLIMKFFSRNKIVQPWYGSYVGDPNGIISKYLKPEYFKDVDNLILDGEMITYDENKGMLLGFQDVKRCCELLMSKLNGGEDLRNELIFNKFLIYDILYYNNESLQLVELKERKNKLVQSLKNFSFNECKFFEIHKWYIGYNSEDIKTTMRNVENRNGEGLVLKAWDSFYYVGTTSPKWVKQKPHYIHDFIDEIDILIIGKEGGNYICALFGDDNSKHKDWYVSFCLVRFGFDAKSKDAIDEKTKSFWIPYVRNRSEIEFEEYRVKFGTLKPNYWIHPENSVVITVKAANFLTSNEQIPTKFILNTTLRHPICIAIRHDKSYFECDTVSDYENKILQHKKFSDNFENKKKNIKRKLITKRDQQLKNINSNFTKIFVKKDDLFKGITFCVKSDCLFDHELKGINEINGILESHGGKLITNPSHYKGENLVIIADKYTLAVSHLSKTFNIFKFKWCYECIKSGRIVNLDISHCLIVDDELKKLASLNIDQFGCNHTVVYNEDQLWEISEKYQLAEVDTNAKLNDEQCDKLLLPYCNKNMILIGYEKYMCYQREIVESYIILLGGNIIETFEQADYVIVPDNEMSKEIQKKNPQMKVVTGNFIIEMCTRKESE